MEQSQLDRGLALSSVPLPRVKVASMWPLKRVSVARKIPEITLLYWLIVALCMWVGVAVADALSEALKLNLTGKTELWGSLLCIAVAFQLASNRFVPGSYWLTMALVGVCGSLMAENVSTHIGLSELETALALGLVLIVTLAVWYNSEKTVSIRAISTWRSEAFVWLAVLFTLALAVALGNVMSGQAGLSHAQSAGIVLGVWLALVMAESLGVKLNTALLFWGSCLLIGLLGVLLLDYSRQLGTLQTGGLVIIAVLLTAAYVDIAKKLRKAIASMPL